MPEPSQTQPLVFSFDPSVNVLGDSKVSEYLLEYLTAIKAKTCVFEADYVDKDFLIDYSKFYARSFDSIGKLTERYHFFALSFTEAGFKEALKSKDTAFQEKLDKKYLGFVVVKPIKDKIGHSLIGRTLLATYPHKNKGELREYLTETYHVSLFGIPLTIDSLPFQVQDTAVGACATIACWISLFPLVSLFGVQMQSPIEVTEKSVSFPADCRNFPSEGLSLYQMKNYFNSIGLETEFIKPEEFKDTDDYDDHDDIISDVVKAYQKLGLPIIACLELRDHDAYPDYHAVVISGYRHKNGDVKELYVHDDNIGPYSVVTPKENGKFYTWENAWLNIGYSDVVVTRLLIPIYPKIRLSFGRIYEVYLKHYKRLLEIQVQSRNMNENSRADLFLTDIRDYKQFLLGQDFDKKMELLCKPMPRFLWVVRIQCEDTPHYDFVYDGTAVYPKLICDPVFKH
jgi:hypothetical protein